MIQPAPTTIYSPKPMVAFSDSQERGRLTLTGLKAFFRVIDAWKVGNEDSAKLLAVSTSTLDRLKSSVKAGKSPRTALTQDQLTRVSSIIGVYKALHLLFADNMADRWPTLENNGPLFGGKTPVSAMIVGGIPHILNTRRLIDAVRGGL